MQLPVRDWIGRISFARSESVVYKNLAIQVDKVEVKIRLESRNSHFFGE
jgi:hypothetical protein